MSKKRTKVRYATNIDVDEKKVKFTRITPPKKVGLKIGKKKSYIGWVSKIRCIESNGKEYYETWKDYFHFGTKCPLYLKDKLLIPSIRKNKISPTDTKVRITIQEL